MNKCLRVILNKSHYADQVFFVSLNFLIVFFASEVLVSEEGVLIIWVLSICALILTMSTSIVVTPLIIFWYDDNISQNALLTISYLLVIGICFINLIGLIIYFNSNSLNFDFSILLFAFLYPLYDFSRRAMYILEKSIFPAIISGLTLFIFVISIIVIYHLDNFRANYIFLSGSLAFSIALFLSLYIQKKAGMLNFPNAIDFKVVFKKQYDYAKYSLGSAFIIWLVTQGPFTFLYGYIPENEYIASRVFLSVTGIIGILFVAFENKMLPRLSESYQRGKSSGLYEQLERLYAPLSKIVIVGTIISFISILVFFPNSHKYLSIGIFYLFSQSLIGFSKRYTLLAKIKLKQHLMLYVSLASLSLVMITSLFTYNHAPGYLAVFCFFSYAILQYFLFYFLNRFKRI